MGRIGIKEKLRWDMFFNDYLSNKDLSYSIYGEEIIFDKIHNVIDLTIADFFQIRSDQKGY